MDKLKIIENIKTLSKVNRIPMATLEKNAKVSVGYFARLSSDIADKRSKNEDERPLPGVEVMIQVARDLGVYLDDLLNIDFTALEEPEIVIINFLGKLTGATRKNTCIWKKVESEQFYKPYDSFELFPLTRNVTRKIWNSEYEREETFDDLATFSLFLNQEIEYEGVFRLDYKGMTFLIAEALDEGTTETNWNYRNYYLELYSLNNGKIQKVANVKEASGNEEKSPLEIALSNLYGSAMRSAKVNPAGDDIVKMVNDYMKALGFDKDN